jgi:hypothetical protein
MAKWNNILRWLSNKHNYINKKFFIKGYWINDELDGPGLKKYPNGETKEEIWRNGI